MVYLKWIFEHFKNKKFLFVSGLVCAVLVGLISTLPPRITGFIIDKVIINGEKNLLLTWLGLFILANLSIAIVRYSKEMIFEKLSQGFLYELRTYLYANLQKLDQPFYNANSTGELMSKFTGDVNAIRHLVAWVIQNFVETVCLFLFSVTVLFFVNAKLAGILMLFIPIAFFINYKLSKKVRPLYFKIREEFTNLTKAAQENIDANKVVKSFVREEYEVECFMEKNENFMNANIKAAFVNSAFQIMINLVTNLMILTTVLIGSYFTIKGEMTIGDFSVFLGLAWALDWPIKFSIIISNDYQRALASAQKLTPLYYAKPQIKSPKRAYKPTNPQGNIVFENVTFSLNEDSIIKNLSFEIKAGETIAVMGPLGSGKTMILNLLMRFYDPDSGRILIDGVDVRDYDLQSLRKLMSISPQDVFLFSDTITNNIAFGEPQMNDDEILECATCAQADSFILNTPQGYDTIIGERGVGLSGGQKQRVALSRALAVKSSILILDDTTSAVDMETEKRIQEALNKRCGLQTTIIIAQRISSVKHCDRIIIIDDGKISVSDNHDELIRGENYYKQIYELQTDTSGFLEVVN